MKFLLVSTSLGAGHDGVAAVMGSELRARGHEVATVDYLHLLPPGVGTLVKRYYAAQLRYAPWSYERSYIAFEHVHGSFGMVNGLASALRTRRAVRAFSPDLIVSNNPHASMALGYLREHGRLDVPVATYVTDFGVHALWVHPGIDRTLVLGEVPASEARLRGGRRIGVVAPLVDSKFTLGQRPEPSTIGPLRVLVTAGSWGVGSLTETLDDLLAMEDIEVTVVCGKDSKLHQQLRRRPHLDARGWVSDMPALLHDHDVLIENAGGLTSLEALASGMRVIAYRPLVGHGLHNARNMAASGLVQHAETASQLHTMLHLARTHRGALGSWDSTASPIDALEQFAAEGR